MKKNILATALLALSVSTFTVSTSHAQEAQTVIPITIPYELTNLDPEVTGFNVMCTVHFGVQNYMWGGGEATVDVSAPSASGNLVVNVRPRGQAIGLDLLDLDHMTYECESFGFLRDGERAPIGSSARTRFARSVERVRALRGNF